jgi:hypothetical protein
VVATAPRQVLNPSATSYRRHAGQSGNSEIVKPAVDAERVFPEPKGEEAKLRVLSRFYCGTVAVAMAMFILAAPAAAAPSCGNGPNNGNTHCVAPSPSATPELDSVILFGSGLLGAAGYGLIRLRARQRDD